MHDTVDIATYRRESGDNLGQRQLGPGLVIVRQPALLLARDVPANQGAVRQETAADADPHRQACRQRCLKTQAGAIDVRHHLQKQDISARFGKDVGHLAVVGGFFFTTGQVARVGAYRAFDPGHHVRHGTRHPDRSSGRRVGTRLACQLDRSLVDRLGLLVQTCTRENMATGREGVGGDHVGSSADVLLVDRAHDVGMRQVRLRAPCRVVHPASQPRDFRACRAIEHDSGACSNRFIQCHDLAFHMRSTTA